MPYRKGDITYHFTWNDGAKPAVNVKVYNWPTRSTFETAARDTLGDDADLALAWWDRKAADTPTDVWDSDGWYGQHHDWIFESACESGWEDLESFAQEVYGPGVKVYAEGRSGGWAYIDGIDHDTDSWDAIAVSRWGRFASYARAVADDIPYRMASLLVLNVYLPEQESLEATLAM